MGVHPWCLRWNNAGASRRRRHRHPKPICVYRSYSRSKVDFRNLAKFIKSPTQRISTIKCSKKIQYITNVLAMCSRGSDVQSLHPNNFHATELCPLKTLELVCIYSARSSRPPAGSSWWVWIGPLVLPVKRGSGAGSWMLRDHKPLLRHTPSGAKADEALSTPPRRLLHGLVHSCKKASRSCSSTFSSGTMKALN